MTAPFRVGAFELPSAEIVRHFARLCACGRRVEPMTETEFQSPEAEQRPAGVCRACWSEFVTETGD